MVKLTDIAVDKPQGYRVVVGGYFGDRRVIYEIPREPLDDYFPHRPHLTDLALSARSWDFGQVEERLVNVRVWPVL
ncbi:hypothetical protein NLM33_46980 (plasmid) [Bradyrhizobium sp. CCGUVB1N3]|uniref:hypothetical protein n=1 Tax=Bradyrhizobium sp. CCGUVB1N3 TaxID=2949629 RepID=UPI0020B2D617|nr:hypothetical protein [Bradyrhizobium sp. CCGUVB1N3]MCP3477689.1 hypothetical protein [Bradyrhizobium sp. CCGUVB1N3]